MNTKDHKKIEQSRKLQEAAKEGKVMPMSFAQQRIWFIDKIGSNAAAYNIVSAIRIKGELRATELKKAINEVVKRHETLRTRFFSIDGRSFQVIVDQLEIDLDYLDSSGIPEVERNERIQTEAKEYTLEKFDLTKLPLVRFKLIKCEDNDFTLLMSMHHIISDEWSTNIFIKEVISFYEHFTDGKPLELDELPIQYSDYAVWQRQSFQKEGLEKHSQYWESKLSGEIPLLQLPTEQVRPPALTNTGETIRFDIESALSDKIIQFSRVNSVTSYMTLLSGFKVLLHRLTKQNDICIGSPVAGRNRSETHGLIGFFTNMLALRDQIDGKESFLGCLDRVKQTTLEAYSNQELPFEKLVDLLNIKRSLSHTPLFQVVFTLQDASSEVINVNGLEFSRLDLETDTAKFDLCCFVCVDTNGEIAAIDVEYNSDIYNASIINQLIGQYKRLLDSCLDNPEQRVDMLPLLTEMELSEQQSWNDTSGALPTKLLHEIVTDSLDKYADKEAVITPAHRMTYKELDKRSTVLAKQLAQDDLESSQLVAVVMKKGWEQVVAVMAILRAGAAYLPIDAALPKDRIQHLLDRCDVKQILTQENVNETIEWDCKRYVVDSQDWEQQYESLADQPLPEITTQLTDIAYVIFTSGSTGQPKGVVIDHQGAVNTILDINDRFNVNEDDKVLGVSSLSFDLSVYDIFGPLAVGGALVLPEAEQIHNPRHWLDLCAKEQVTLWDTVPALLQLMLSELSSQVKRGEFSGELALRQALLSGDWIPLTLPDLAKSFLPNFKLCSLGGATEASIWSIHYPIETLEKSWKSIPYGYPLRNQRFYVLDENLQPCPSLVIGDLYIGGIGLAKGYWRDEERTAASFIVHPETSERLYRTGDLGRYMTDPKGAIEYMGRADFQVKIRGFRVELGEIESVIGDHPDVSSTVVLAREDNGNKQLVAYYVASKPIESSDIRAYVKNKLPDYMVPAHFVDLDEIPLSSNGKVDRNKLPKPKNITQDDNTRYVAPRNELETKLVMIWADALGLEKVGIDDNFFELGGDSILGIQITARAREQDVYISPRQLFEFQTVRELAFEVSENDAGRTGDEIVATQDKEQGVVPLTPIQKWFFSSPINNRQHWNQAIMLSVKESMEYNSLVAAVQATLNHHDGLRLAFVQNDENPNDWKQMHIEEISDPVCNMYDLSDIEESEANKEVLKQTQSLQRSFDLDQGSMLRVAYFKLDQNQDDILFLCAHHLIVDAVSWQIILNDLQTAYQHHLSGETIHLPLKTTSFKYWSDRLTQYSNDLYGNNEATEILPEHEYWQSVVRDIEPLRKDNDGENLEGSAKTYSTSLETEETKLLLNKVPPAYRTQILDILLTALNQVLGEWNNHNECLVNVEGHGREDIFSDVDLSRTVGWFTSLYPMRLGTDFGEHLGSSIKHVKEQLRNVPHNGLDFGIWRYSKGNKSRILPEAEISFNYLGQVSQAFSGNDTFEPIDQNLGLMGDLRDPNSERPHLIDIVAMVNDDELKIDWSYASEIYNQSTIEYLATNYTLVLRAIIKHCVDEGYVGITPSDYPLSQLSQEEMDTALGSVKDIEDIYPLSPMQEGLMFYSLMDPESGVYMEQMTCSISSEIDSKAFKSAWISVIQHYENLASSFIWEGVKKPIQVLRKLSDIELTQEDWGALSPSEQDRKLKDKIHSSRLQKYSLDKAPLMNFHLIRLGDEHYQFIWNYHHLLIDGWSLGLVIKEVLLCYEHKVKGSHYSLENKVPYRNYISWLQNQDINEAKDYWQEYLNGFDTLSKLTLSTPAASQNSSPQFIQAKHELSLLLSEKLSAFSKDQRVTLNTVFLGAWSLILSRLSGVSDVVFGNTVSGRSAQILDIESMVGLFINTLPIRVKLDTQLNVVEWLSEIQNKQAVSREYEHVPLEQIQKWCKVSPATGLFDTLFVYENYPIDEQIQELGGELKIDQVTAQEQTNYPFTLIAAYENGQFCLRYIVDEQLYEQDAIERVHQLLSIALDSIAQPDQVLQNISLVDTKDQETLQAFNQTQSVYPSEQGIAQVFEDQVIKTPDAHAVAYHDTVSDSWGYASYQQMNSASNRLARYLLDNGVTQNSLVGICIERSVNMITTLIAILKCSAVYVPLDTALPKSRLSYLIEDVNPSLVVTNSDYKELIEECGSQTIVIEEAIEESKSLDSTNVSISSSSEDPAYIMYTSGTTGKPKGVEVRQKGILRLVLNTNYVELGEQENILQYAPLAFDASTFEIWGSLLNGGVLTLMPAGMQSLDDLGQHIQDQNVTTAWLTSALFNMIVDHNVSYLGNLRQLLVGGEALSVPHVLAAQKSLPSTQIINGYGPTENTTFTCCYRIPPLSSESDLMPIGKPVANTQVYILDESRCLLPIGVVGEIYAAGDGVAIGYLNKPELTEKVFVDDPFSSRHGAKMYKTGDLGRYLPDGTIEFLGRRDSQVKISGHRIELQEISNVLAGCALVEDVYVTVVDEQSQKRIVAYYVAQEDISEAELREFDRENLPAYMRPNHYLKMEAFPLTPNGKVDSSALPNPEVCRAGLVNEFVEPSSDIEKALADIWSEVLAVKQVGITDNFFELGGTSLQITQILSRVKTTFGISPPLKELFESPTIAICSSFLEQNENQNEAELKEQELIDMIDGMTEEEINELLG